jgi:hypothetical protein
MNTTQKIDIPLHDIKPLVEIQDYSLYYFSAVVIVGSFIVLALLYLVYRYLKHKNKVNTRKEYYKKLEAINLKDTKKAAYELTKYGLIFADDNSRNAKTYEELIDHLAQYKYKKEVGDFDAQTKRYIDLYRGMIDV